MTFTAKRIIIGLVVIAALVGIYFWQFKGLEGLTVEQLFEKHRTASGATPAGAREMLLQKVTEEDYGTCMAALRHSSMRTRLLAVAALRQLRDERSVDALITALSDPEPDVREEAAKTFGSIRVKKPVPDLIKLLHKDHPQEVKNAAGKALRKITGQTSYALNQDKWQEWWKMHGINFRVKDY